MAYLTALLAGLVFGIGLIVSRMSDPSKVLGFLDVAGRWDPSLAMVMVSAISVATLAFRVATRRTQSLLGAPMQLPVARSVDRRLVIGSLMFGVGWGLAGYCPGPALVSLTTGGSKPAIFCAAMVAGMALFELAERWRLRRARLQAPA